jgi:hypothetical protein
MATKVCVEIGESDEPGTPEPIRSYNTVIGDGTTTSYTITHGLDTRDPLYVVRDVASGVLDGSDAAVTVVDQNKLRLDFPTAPTSGAISVTVLKA